MKQDNAQILIPAIISANDEPMSYPDFHWIGTAEAVGLVVIIHFRSSLGLGTGFAAECPEAK